MKNYLYVFLMTLFLLSCSLDPFSKDPDKIVLKKFQTTNYSIEVFYFSLMTSSTPVYVTSSSNIKVDTLLIASNISSVSKLGLDSISITTIGNPRLYNTDTDISSTHQGLKVITNSNGITNIVR
jgi:hypothetical protein